MADNNENIRAVDISIHNHNQEETCIMNESNGLLESEASRQSFVTMVETQNNLKETCTINGTNDLLEFDVIGKNECEETVEPEDATNYSNIIMLGSIVPNKTESPSVSKQPKRKKPSELESLGVTEFEENYDKEYDIFADESDKIYRKYKLRTVTKKPNYRIPNVNDIPLEYIQATPETYSCSQPSCIKTFNNKQKLQAHMRQEHDVKFTCSLCSQTFETNAQLISHKTEHKTENRSFICYACKLAFSDHCDFLIHESTHKKFKSKFTCPECGQILFFRHSFQGHIQLHFKRLTTCTICSEEVPEQRFREHVRNHSSKIECVECGKIYTNNSSYEQHMANHTGVKIHQCLYCGKGFVSTQQKEIHTRIHTNERPFSCKICDRTFMQYTNMQRHLLRHNKEKKEECNLCHKKYNLKSDLNLHMRTHKKAYSCPDCGMKFSIMRSLKHHTLLIHSTERPIECKLCSRSFISQIYYKKHTQSKMHKRFLFKQEKEACAPKTEVLTPNV